MKLKCYLIERNVSICDFSNILGISTRYLYHIIEGVHKPGHHLCVRIEIHTGGRVKPIDFGITKRERKKREVKNPNIKIQPGSLLDKQKHLTKKAAKPKLKQMDMKDIMKHKEKFESLVKYGNADEFPPNWGQTL